MNTIFSIFLRAAIIALICFCIGSGSNFIRAWQLPWLYIPPNEITISGHKIPFCTADEAEKWLDDPQTVFIDTRHEKDYAAGHVRGAIFLSPENKEQRFPGIEPLVPQGSKLILYCYGPDCDMAETVAAFLIDLGHSHLMIMSDGYPGWEQKGLPIEQSNGR
ncbi:MAG: rhodanese-like domain-containing protein [Deltaproteobacteria bacterium]|nr:rhodanese-like domain-containing protein [Deltaproteobacteria bacterium]